MKLLRAATLCLAPLLAQSKFVTPLPPDSAITVRRDLPYRDLPQRPLAFDLYRPAALPGRLPVLIFLDANGTGSQRSWEIYQSWAKLAAANGFAAVNADTHAEGIEEDFDALLDYLAAHAGELGVDPGRITLYAASSNVVRGYPLAQDPRHTRLKAAVFYYGSSPRPASFRPDLPVLMVRAGLDRPGLNEQIGRLAARALDANAPFTVWNHPTGHHGFEVIDDDDATRAVIRGTLEWLKSNSDPAFHAGLQRNAAEAEAARAIAGGNPARAAEIYARLTEQRPEAGNLFLAYGEALLAAKRYREAGAAFEQARQLKGGGPRDIGWPAARAAALAGDAAAAIRWLEWIPARFRPANLAEEPDFASLRGRPDFQALLPK